MGAFTSDVAVVGGCGHVGLPLAIAFADRGLTTRIYDTDAAAVERVRNGVMSFYEPGAEEPLSRALASGKLEVSADAAVVAMVPSRFSVCILMTRHSPVCGPCGAGYSTSAASCSATVAQPW